MTITKNIRSDRVSSELRPVRAAGVRPIFEDEEEERLAEQRDLLSLWRKYQVGRWREGYYVDEAQQR